MMKRSVYILVLILGAYFGKAQAGLYMKLNAFVADQTKEDPAHRLIAINVWSVNDKKSRDLNSEFEETFRIFRDAKLKGGNKGIIVLNFNMDKDEVSANVTLKKDGIEKMINIPSDNAIILEALKNKTAGYNVVFDEKGNIVYENIAPGSVKSSVQQLITR
jgi:hypothetical protein